MRKMIILILIIHVVFFVSTDLFAQDSENIEKISSIYDCWDRAMDLRIDGDLLYVATGYTGMRVIDMSDPSDPEEIGSYDTPGYCLDVLVDDTIAYVADAGGFLRILSVSDPHNPVELGFVAGQTGAFTLTKSGDLLFLTGEGEEGGLCIFDVSTPNNPEVLSVSYDADNGVDIVVSGDYAYIADVDGALTIVDISNPSNPQGINVIGDECCGVAIHDELLFTCHENVMVIWDVSSPEQPEFINWYGGEWGDYLGIAVVDEYAYVFSKAGLTILNVVEPDTILEISSLSLLSSDVFSDEFKVGIDLEDDLVCLARWGAGARLVDVSDRENPTEVGYYSTEKVMDVAVAGEVAFIAKFDGGIKAIDLCDLQNPTEIGGNDSPNTALNITIHEDLAFVVDGDSGLIIFDVQNPEEIVEVGIFREEGLKGPVIVVENYVYIAREYSNLLKVIDISNPEQPSLTTTLHTWNYDISDISLEGDYIYVLCSYEMYIVNVTNPDQPEPIRNYYRTESNATVIDVSGDLAYLAGYSGIEIVDVSDPTQLQQITTFVLSGSATDIEVKYGFAFILTGPDGFLRIMDLRDPQQPRESGYHQVPGYPLNMEIWDDLVLVANISQIGIYDASAALNVPTSEILQSSSFVLCPAYPNPFNSTTTIIYGLGKPASTRLALYDLSGREVRTLFEGYRQAGFHSVNLNAGDLPSGLYFLKLEGMGLSASCKIMLIK